MGAGTVIEEQEGAGAAAGDFREALERALAAADADDAMRSTMCATDLRLRFEITDAALELSVAAGGLDERLHWTFGPVDWDPGLTLSMSSRVANRYLQGRESLAVAIAHGEVQVRGNSRVALRYLPAAQLISGPYRAVVEADFPSLAL